MSRVYKKKMHLMYFLFVLSLTSERNFTISGIPKKIVYYIDLVMGVETSRTSFISVK